MTCTFSLQPRYIWFKCQPTCFQSSISPLTKVFSSCTIAWVARKHVRVMFCSLCGKLAVVNIWCVKNSVRMELPRTANSHYLRTHVHTYLPTYSFLKTKAFFATEVYGCYKKRDSITFSLKYNFYLTGECLDESPWT